MKKDDLDLRRSDIAEQWKKMSAYFKRKLIKENPERVNKVINKLYDLGGSKNQQVAKRILKSYLRELGTYGKSGTNLVKATKSQVKTRIKEAQDRKVTREKMKQLRKIWKWVGMTPDTTQAVIDGMPNYRVLRMGYDKYYEMRKLMNDLPGNPNRIPVRQLQKQVKGEWDEAIRLFDEEQIRTKEELQKHAIGELHKFLLRYFKNIPRRDETIYMVEQYFKFMTPQQIFGIREMMQSDLFKRNWDSDQHTLPENTEEVANNRVYDLFKVLRNEAGMNIVFGENPTNYKIEVLPLKQTGEWTINHFTTK